MNINSSFQINNNITKQATNSTSIKLIIDAIPQNFLLICILIFRNIFHSPNINLIFNFIHTIFNFDNNNPNISNQKKKKIITY